MTPSLKFETTESHSLLTPRRIITCAILLTMIPSCAVLESSRGGSTTAAQPSSAISTNSSSNQNSQTAIPVMTTTSFAEQQSLIDEINRDGEPTNYSGFREDVPVPTATLGEDIVELNYEQADLRLVLEELADALDISIVIDPTIDTQISIRTSADRPLQRDDIWPLIRLLTRDAGILLERVGDIYNARV